MRSTVIRCRAILAMVIVFSLGHAARAQQDNPVYVDDSPQARELLRQARDQTRENAGEAVRLYQELLSDFALRLVPSSDVSSDQYTSARRRVLAALLSNQQLLDRYRLVQTPAAEQLLQRGELFEAAMAYTLTEPGIEAMLRLAQRELEAGRFHAAIAWLDQILAHPDCFGRRAAHAHFMAALAQHDLDDDHAMTAHRLALEDLGPDGAAFLLELDQLLQAQSLLRQSDTTLLDRGPEPALSDVVPQAIWSIPLDDSLLRRRLRAVQEREDFGNNPRDDRLRNPDLATAAVTVVGPRAFVNEGHTIVALERLTGREEWSYQDLSRLGLTEPGNVLDALDLNMVVVDGDTLVSLTGHAQPNRRSDSGRVICLDVTDGAFRWSSKLSGVIDTAADEELFAHGSPIIIDGRVFVLARKVSTQLLTSAFVIALDADDGRVLWSRYLASSGGLRIAARPFDSLVASDGALYVSSAVGTTARLDPATGEMLWLRRFNVPISQPLADQTRRPWEMIAPVVTNRGLVTLQPDSRRVELLDLDTGDELANHSAGSSGDWNSPRYLLSDGDHVFSVGSDIRGFNIDNLEEPVWRIPAPGVQAAPNEPPPLETIDMRGRVQLAGSKLIAPTMHGVLVIDAVTGAIDQTLPVDAGGNPLAYESQLMIAGADRLDAYMSLRRAEELLRRQMAQSPDSPEPALSLLRLGMRAGNVALALEAADKAMQATEAHADDPAYDARRFAGRAELFSLLLDVARTNKALSPEQGEAVFARLQLAAVGPEQRVEHLLAYGDWLAPRALPRAIETWQTVLSDQRLAPVWLNANGVARTARSRVAERIGRIVATRGPSAYAPQSDFAALRLSQLRSDNTVLDTDALTALAQEFPFAPTAVDAALQVADLCMERGDTRAAIAALIGAYVAAPGRDSAGRLFGRVADLAERAGWNRQACDALQAVRAAWGDVLLTSAAEAGGEIRIDDRLRELGCRRREALLGGVAGQGVILGAPLLARTKTMSEAMPTDRALLRSGNTIEMVTSAEMKAGWSTTVEGSSPQILRFDDQAIVLWFGADPENPRAVRLNPADGSIVWTTQRLAEVLPGAAGGTARLRASREQLPNGESYDPAETLAAMLGETLLLIHRGGAIAALDGRDGRRVKWSRATTLEQVHLVEVRQGLLVLAGTSRDVEANAQQAGSPATPRIVVLDALTGKAAFGGDGVIVPPTRGGIKWMTVSPFGLLVYGTTEGIDAVNLNTGVRAWSAAEYAVADSQRGWAMNDRVVFEDQRSRLRTIRLADGVVSETFELPLRGEWDPMELRDLIVNGETVIAHYRQRIVIFDAETGSVVGADAVPDDRDYRWLLPTEDRLFAISGSSVQAPMNNGGGGGGRIVRTQYQYTAYPLSRNGKVLGNMIRTPPLAERVQQVVAIDGWLLFSTLTDTLAVPMSDK